MISKLLPAYCYSHRTLASVEGVVIHYMSAKNVVENDRYNMHHCRHLLVDINRKKHERKWFMKSKIWPAGRMHASAHLLIGRGGEVWQLVPFDKQAYHAGASMLNGRTSLNRWTLGIELVGDQQSGFSREQYESLVGVLIGLEQKHGFNRDNVVGHDTVRHNAIEAGSKAKKKYDPSGRSDGLGDNMDWWYLGKMWNDNVPNPSGTTGLERLDEVLAASTPRDQIAL